MRRTLALTAALIAVTMACDPTGPLLGPLDFGIIQGREQQAVAGDAQLDTAVVAMVWRDASGQAFIGAAPLYAQTTVTGVVGAVVCVGEVPIEGEPIIPHSRCTATQSDGTAVFHLTPPTKAGTHRTPIVAELDGVALTPDTVTAEVSAAPAHEWSIPGAVNDTIDANGNWVRDQYQNPITFRLEVVDAPAHVLSTDFADSGSRMLAADSLGSGSVRAITVAGDTATSTLTIFVNAGGSMEMSFDRWTAN